MCAGGVIQSIGDSQDIRSTGGLSIYIPFTSSSLMVFNFALCGIPFLAEFYFRDVFYEICEHIWFLIIVCIYGFKSLLFFPFILLYSAVPVIAFYKIYLHLVLERENPKPFFALVAQVNFFRFN